MVKKVIGVFIAATVLFSGCMFNFSEGVDFDVDTFTEEYEVWKKSDVKNYKYILRRVGFDGAEFEVAVADGKTSQKLISENYDGDESTIYESIEKVYDIIYKDYTDNNFRRRLGNECFLKAIKVTYDTKNHIPLEWHYDYYTPEGMIMDGNFDFYIKDFALTEK